MKSIRLVGLAFVLLLVGCQTPTPAPTATPSPEPEPMQIILNPSLVQPGGSSQGNIRLTERQAEPVVVNLSLNELGAQGQLSTNILTIPANSLLSPQFTISAEGIVQGFSDGTIEILAETVIDDEAMSVVELLVVSESGTTD